MSRLNQSVVDFIAQLLPLYTCQHAELLGVGLTVSERAAQRAHLAERFHRATGLSLPSPVASASAC
jgi:hypothetical protein